MFSFILNIGYEVEVQTVYLQNKDMGINHAPNDNNFKYKAWYKAEDKIIVGKNVSPKTDPGPYIIEPTADVTLYACNEVIMGPGFHAKAGSRYHAFIKCDNCKGPDYRPSAPPEQKSIETQNSAASKATHFNTTSRHHNDSENIQVYPNPSHGDVTVHFPKKDVGQYQILNLQGKVIRQGIVHEERNVFQFSKGTYILKWICNTSVQTKKIIVL